MPKFSAPVDLQRGELRNAVTQNLGTAPSAPVTGLRYYDTALNFERYWNGTAWVDIGGTVDVSDITGLGALATLDEVGASEITAGSITNTHISGTAAIDLSKLATDPLDRANHTGTQLAATISDFDTQVRTSRLDQMATPTASVGMGNQTITGLGAPVNPTDAATMGYVDSVAQGLDVKTACRVASTANVTLASPGASIDGIALANGDRVLLKDQTTASENGIYVFDTDSTPLVRSADADTDAEVVAGMFTFVTEGTANADKGFVLTTDNPITVDTTDLEFTQFSGSGTVTGTADRITVTSGQVDIAATYVGQTSLTTLGTITTGTWTGTTIAVANGGTGATTAAGARTNLGAVGKHTETFGDGIADTFAITHSLGTTAVGVEIWDAATGQTVYADVTRTDANTVTIDGFVSPPASNALNVVVWG